MIKHSLTILVSISLIVIFIYYSLFSPKKESFKIKSFPVILSIENNMIKGSTALPLREIILSSPNKIPSYEVVFKDNKNFTITFFDYQKEGWQGLIYIKAIGEYATLTKKIFISLEKEENSLEFFILSFSPTHSKKKGNPSLEIKIKEEGNLFGYSLQIESPTSYRYKYTFPLLEMKKDEVWKIIFAYSKDELKGKKNQINQEKKEIQIPFKISDTIGAFSFIKESNQEIKDFLIYSNKKEEVSVESLLKAIKINLETIQNKKGFPFREILSEDIVRTYRSKVGSNRKLVRENPEIPFKNNNSYPTPR